MAFGFRKPKKDEGHLEYIAWATLRAKLFVDPNLSITDTLIFAEEAWDEHEAELKKERNRTPKQRAARSKGMFDRFRDLFG